MSESKAVSKYAPKLSLLEPEVRGAILDQVMTRYMNGEQIADIAPDFGCTDPPIYHALLAEREQEWKDAQTARALARLEDATFQMDKAIDVLSLARARDRVKAAQWELERLLRRLYGQDAPNQAGTVAIQINIGAAQTAVPTVHPVIEQD